NLLLTIIDNVEKTICGCKKCNGCEDCDDCDSLMATIISVLSFVIVNNPKYNDLVNDIFEQVKCSVDEKVLCLLLNEQIRGKSDIKELLKEIASLYYLAFYSVDIALVSDASEFEYVKNKYKSQKILKCIKNEGIALTIIDGLFDSTFDNTFD